MDFENVYYVKELQQFNLFSISQICDKKNRVLFIDTDCLVLSKDFMLPDESMVVLRVPRKHNLYTINLNNLSPKGNLACLVAKASVDESVKWHRRMGHVNYKNMNRLVKDYLTDYLGYKRDKANRSAGTQDASTNPAEAEPKDISSDEVDDSPLDYAEEIFQKELARLNVPTGSIQIPSGDTTISPGSVPVPTGCPTDSFFDNEPTT
ncbi:putative ribonuclease H-like domain-containing protein [Tanacetum coccineum]